MIKYSRSIPWLKYLARKRIRKLYRGIDIEKKKAFSFVTKSFSIPIWNSKRERRRFLALAIVGSALNLRAYEFVSQEIRTAEDPEFEAFYTKNILLNEGESTTSPLRLLTHLAFKRKSRTRLLTLVGCRSTSSTDRGWKKEESKETHMLVHQVKERYLLKDGLLYAKEGLLFVGEKKKGL
ncbi:hypothetical protein MTR67_050959 [Solanum verrucosum]|uniref:Uncharacterized protein n=1 Tax=Solanum verrucosum TaxID=315347 RepID=A0AAF1A2C0_SOLVR|nr:hypothetical protein MTR67_050959 [Solanum verrucosum]